MTFDIPRNVILPVDEVGVRLDPGPHPFETANRAAIEANWRREKAANPALFDGKVVLLAQLSYRAGRIEGRCHLVRYATFLHWRSVKPVASAEHTYAHAMLAAADGALVAVRMGAHTANAGRVYFAAGSFEEADFSGAVADADFNMAREVREETGLDITRGERENRLHAYSDETGTVLFRRYHLAEDAESIAGRIRAFVASESDPEIEGPVIIRTPNDLPDGLMAHMRPLVAWHFDNP
ncbi:NUDIX hydrolase [Mesorhizobium xinjiangense]|uniref:hypothetical protein n=1 Tax=Mesorhizobium xinjiangense TaxID=2678685 RepID=UPI0012ECE12C|nr:hypothetical protein [Mesorhizobium xinjiangense]